MVVTRRREGVGMVTEVQVPAHLFRIMPPHRGRHRMLIRHDFDPDGSARARGTCYKAAASQTWSCSQPIRDIVAAIERGKYH